MGMDPHHDPLLLLQKPHLAEGWLLEAAGLAAQVGEVGGGLDSGGLRLRPARLHRRFWNPEEQRSV